MNWVLEEFDAIANMTPLDVSFMALYYAMELVDAKFNVEEDDIAVFFHEVSRSIRSSLTGRQQNFGNLLLDFAERRFKEGKHLTPTNKTDMKWIVSRNFGLAQGLFDYHENLIQLMEEQSKLKPKKKLPPQLKRIK